MDGAGPARRPAAVAPGSPPRRLTGGPKDLVGISWYSCEACRSLGPFAPGFRSVGPSAEVTAPGGPGARVGVGAAT